jgi:tRNA(fMet)-specific endonuclease VapC
MKYLLDTNICVYWLNGNQNIEQKAIQVGLSQIAISFITLSELYYGAYKSQKVQKNLNSIKTLEDKLLRIDSNREICKTFGQLKSELEKGGNIIDDADLFIAFSALTANLVLVTNNERHFSRIKGLKIENWSKAG